MIPKEERCIAMKSDLMSKLSASFFVLVMVLSALVVVLPAAVVKGQAPGTNDIYVPVLGQFSLPVPSATVTLTNVHSGQTVQATYIGSPSLFFRAQSAPSGYYRLDVTASGYYDAINAGWFSFNGLASYTTNAVQLQAFPTKTLSWNITVSPARSGITVGFYDGTMKQIVASGTTNSIGYAVVSMFDTTQVPGDTFYLFAKGGGFETYLQQMVVTTSGSPTITLTASKQVVGFVNTDTGLGQNVVAYLLNQNTSVPWIKRLLKSPAALGSFSFDAYPGDFILSVKADGVISNVTTLSITSGTTNPLTLTMTLHTQTAEQELTNIVYDSNYRSFNMTLGTTLAYDQTIPGLLYSDAGSLRLQIDLNTTTPDGTVSTTEASNFADAMEGYGPKNVTTPWLLSLNKTSTSSGVFYLAKAGFVNFNLGSTAGSVTSTASVAYSYKATYAVVIPSGVTAPSLTSTIYTMAMDTFHDKAFVNYVFTVQLMPNFELVDNSTSDTTVFVGGYHNFTLNPSTGTGVVSYSLTVEKAIRPVAKGGLDTSSTVYVLKNATGVVLKYFVSVGNSSTFTANSSYDPNGNPLTYIWNFSDGTPPLTTTNKTANHTYASASLLRVVNLTVQDVEGLTNNSMINVTCDGLDPVAIILLKNRTLVDGTLFLNQSESFIINATSKIPGQGSYDNVATVGDRQGLINYAQFSWGDGNVSGRIMRTDDQQNTTWSYVKAGDYTIWLNVTDVVGHHDNVSLPVHVNDTTPPTVSFTVKNATGGTTLVEQQRLYFNASATRDNVDNYTKMFYAWSFGDGSTNVTGVGKYYVNHTYAKLGSYTVSLNVTDLSNNSRKITKDITVNSKPRPNLKVDNATYLPPEFTEGQTGTIVVNVTNVGTSVAKNITVSFYIQNLDGTEKLIGSATASQIFNGTTSAVTDHDDIRGRIVIKFAYTPPARGTYTIKVVANATDQLTESVLILSGPNALVVNEAAWKVYALWGGVIGVIILVPLLIYFSRRWSRRERKGPRREKKSEAE